MRSHDLILNSNGLKIISFQPCERDPFLFDDQQLELENVLVWLVYISSLAICYTYLLNMFEIDVILRLELEEVRKAKARQQKRMAYIIAISVCAIQSTFIALVPKLAPTDKGYWKDLLISIIHIVIYGSLIVAYILVLRYLNKTLTNMKDKFTVILA